MLVEVLSTAAMSGLLAYTVIYQKGLGGDDAKKIQNIAANCGLVAKDGKTIRIHRKTKKKNYTEYVFQMPQGLSSKEFQNKLDHFQDGLNIKKTAMDLSLTDFKDINWKGDIIQEFKRILQNKKKLRKDLEITFDGMLIFRVFNEAHADYFEFDESLIKSLKDWEIPVGIDRTGKLIKHNFETIPHMALGGATRYGKSVFLNMLINTLILKHGKHVSFTLIDLKGGVEFGDYEHVKQVENIAFEPEEARDALENAYNEMRAIQDKLRNMGFKKVQDAGIKDRHFVIIDEVGELNPDEAVTREEKQLKEECQTFMSQIARLGAGFSVRQILATQYPTGDVIPRQCKQNSDAKLCFRVRNATASRVVLDEAGAEELPLIRGRAIYQTDKKHIVQTPLIKDDFIKQTIQPHINIKPRKEGEKENAKSDREGATTGGNTLVIEETSLS